MENECLVGHLQRRQRRLKLVQERKALPSSERPARISVLESIQADSPPAVPPGFPGTSPAPFWAALKAALHSTPLHPNALPSSELRVSAAGLAGDGEAEGASRPPPPPRSPSAGTPASRGRPRRCPSSPLPRPVPPHPPKHATAGPENGGARPPAALTGPAAHSPWRAGRGAWPRARCPSVPRGMSLPSAPLPFSLLSMPLLQRCSRHLPRGATERTPVRHHGPAVLRHARLCRRSPVGPVSEHARR